MTSKEIHTLFAKQLKQFKPINRQPTVADILCIRKVLTLLLLVIPYDEANAVHNLVRLIMDDAKYAAGMARASSSRPNQPPTIK